MIHRQKKRIYYFLLFFGTFLIFIGVTGYVQISGLQRNMEALLEKEAEIIYGHFLREINIQFEYLELVDRSIFIMTPSFLDVMTYEETVIEKLILELMDAIENDPLNIPVQNYILLDKEGKTIKKRGNTLYLEKLIPTLLSGKERVSLRTKADDDNYLTFGLRLNENFLIFSLSKKETAEIKRKYLLKDIIETVSERLNLVGLSIYDADGKPYYTSYPQDERYFKFRKSINSKYLQGYSVEILLSRDLIDETLKKMTVHLLITLLFLVALSGVTGYAIFVVERRLEKKIVEFERDMARKERLLSLGMLSSTMAHEIRNPLNAISLSLQRLKREFLPSDSRRDEFVRFLDVVGGEVSRINRIVEDFLLLSKPKGNLEHVNLRVLTDEVFLLLKEKVEPKGIELKNLLPNEATVKGQRERLKQLFFNLILNAVEAVEERGYVKVSAEKHPGGIWIKIEDNGSGIEKEKLEKIFEYHYTTKDKGIGLGLPIAYTIIKDLGGEIKMESEKGRGTTVKILFPRNINS
ncbi:MAG: ATP-binding protein [Deltaproteobacteria bacterium]|nr:ATP-binding protein [Deltaproteobacteria bacterium]